MWLGTTKKIMSILAKQHQGIVVMREDNKVPEVIAKGEHFWHGSFSVDGKWMVSDTNWTDHGIHLIHVATKKYKVLCYPNS